MQGSRDEGHVVLCGVWWEKGKSRSDGSANTGLSYVPDGEADFLCGDWEVQIRERLVF